MKKRLQIFFSIILLLTFSWQCAAKSVIYIHFKLNQDELAKTVCENKDKPKSCCAAKCQLTKEIGKEEKRQADIPGSIKDKSEKSELNTTSFSYSFIRIFSEVMIDFFYLEKHPTNTPNSFFHPPCIM